MAIYNTGYVSILLTKEGAAKGNELRANGIDIKVTHMRVYRSPTLVQNIPYTFTGNENRALLNSWQCFPNHATTFEVIEDFTQEDRIGYLTLVGVLGADVGTFSYDIVGLFLEDDTLYAVCATNRLLTKRKASIGSSSNIQELSFGIAHDTLQEVVNFSVVETVVDYTKITEVNFVHDLPTALIPKEVIYRVTDGTLQTYKDQDSFRTFLASQRLKTVGGTTKHMWVPHDHIQLFERFDLSFKFVGGNLELSIPKNSRYPIDLLMINREVILSFFNSANLNIPAAIKMRLTSRSAVGLNNVLTFSPIGVTLSIANNTTVKGTVYASGFDSLYQDAVQSAIKIMTEIQYSGGRTLKTDNMDLNPATALESLWQRSSTWQKLDSKIPVATSIFDGRLFNPSQLQPIVNKPGSINHMKLRATNIWLNTANGSFQPNLTLDRSFVVFGQTLRATISADDVQEGTQVAWYVRSPDKQGLIATPNRNVGYVELDANGVGYVDFTINWAEVDSQYPIYVGLVGYNIERMVTIIPVNASIYFASDAAGNTPITEADEGDQVYIIVKSTYPFNGLSLFIKREAGSSANDYDIIEQLPSEVELTSGKSSTLITIKNDETNEGGEVLILGLYSDGDKTNKLGTDATLTIGDTSQEPNPIYQMFFAASQFSDTPLVANSALGDTVWLIVKATNVPPTHNVTLELAGDFDRIADAEPNLPATVNMTLTNGRGAYRIISVAPAVEAPTGPIKRTLIIAANRTETFNIYNEYVNAFGTPSGDIEVTVKVESGVYVVGTNTSLPAIDGRGSWTPGTILKIDNYGFILGRGGKGGSRSVTVTDTNVPGGNGGTAIIAQDTHPIYVTNYGSAYVSGGGGGSGGAYMDIYYSELDERENEVFYNDFWSIGGGGGAPLGVSHVPTIGENPGSTGSTVDRTWIPFSVPNATYTTPGSGTANVRGGSVVINGGNIGNAGSITGVTTEGKKSNDGIAGAISVGPVYISSV